MDFAHGQIYTAALDHLIWNDTKESPWNMQPVI